MIRLLLKKQLAEIFKAYFFNARKNKARSRVSTILCFVLFAFLMIFVMGFIFGSLSFSLCPIITLGFSWLYYAIIGLIAILFGVFGSVFSTYSGLYLAKDNDLLLSMPISVRAIMASRLSGVYLMGLLYSAAVTVPAVIVRFFTVSATAANIIGAVLFILLVSLFVLSLSCIFGYFVAKISLKLKNKSFITVIISLAFFATYYFIYFNANTFLGNLIKNITVYGETVKERAYFVYIIGCAAEGRPVPLIMLSAVVLLLLYLTLYVISRSFIKIATSSSSVTKVKYRQRNERRHSLLNAMLLKELKRFTSSPNYMLNCGLGLVFMIAAGGFALFKGGTLRELISGTEYENLIYIGACAVTALMISTNDIAAPSVSLEGKTIWQVRALPIDTKTVLKSKYLLEIYINILPAVFCIDCFIIALRPDAVTGLLMVLLTLANVIFFALFDLYCGLHKINLNWTNEVVPIKQGINILFAVFGGFLFVLVSALPFLFLGLFMSAKLYMLILLVLTLLFSLLIYRWINKKGVRIFESL